MLHSPISTASFAIAVASATLIGGYLYLELQNPSPGELSAVHAQVVGLANGKNCAACHGAPETSMREACLGCHQEIGEQLLRSTGLHGTVPAPARAQCATCHSEHHGSEFPVTSAKSFELAGVFDLAHFDHANLNFQLTGIHLSLQCKQCHAQAGSPVLPAGAHRFIGLKQDCQACHTDVHRGQFGLDCASCHGQDQPFDKAANFRHTDEFPLDGAHANRSCNACHATDSANSVPALLSRGGQGLPREKTRTCSECHNSPHTPILISVVAATLQLDSASTCQVCHLVGHPTFKGPFASISPEIHAAVGFPLAPPHQDLACQKCHLDFGTTKPTSVAFVNPPRSADNCRACHSDPHLGQFDDPNTGLVANCLACHSDQHFLPVLFDVAYHEKTKFPLHGSHSKLRCAQCHDATSIPGADVAGKLEASQTARVFRGTKTNCRDCHRDPHNGQFTQGVFHAADCGACHDDHTFSRPTFTTAQHDSTQFSLTGAHRAVGCNECHKAQVVDIVGKPDALDGHVATARQFHGTASRCDACHVDVHAGAFAPREHLGIAKAAMDCSQCHSTESFNTLTTAKFDHEKWTGFALRGTHAQASCSACHADAPAPDANDRVFGKAAGRNCQDCHRDPHAGQFGQSAEVNCATCHVDGNSFHELAFDHQRDSRFKLDEVHVKLDCIACHRSSRLTNGEVATRYKPLGTECADCHLPQLQSDRSRQP